jgi:hypothetical protein
MKQKPTGFSVFAYPRPIRIAFIVDPETISEELIDAIYDFNLLHWGGRYNPIIPIVDNSIADSYWELLKFCDPDIVYSCVKLNESLLQRIKRWISPNRIEIHREQPELHHLVQLYHEQVNVEEIARNYRTNLAGFKENFVLPICSYTKEWEHRRFFQRNFGLIAEYTRISHFDNFSRLMIEGDSKPEDFLTKLNSARNLVFPMDFCKASIDFPQTVQSHLNDCFTIVLGDSAWSWIYSWNTIFYLSDLKRRNLSQMSIPMALLESDKALAATKKFLKSQLPWSSSQHPRIEVISFDKTEEELKEITLDLNKEIGAYWTVKQLQKAVFPKVERWPQNIESHVTTQHYQVFGTEVFIRTPTPDFLAAPESSFWTNDRRWVVDLKIEYRPERFSYTNVKYWWRLPKFLDVALSFGASRITFEGFVSVSCSTKEKNLKVRIPRDGQVVLAALMSGTNSFDPYYQPNRKATGPYRDYEMSDKGGYLRGFVNLFPSLWHASEFCNNRFWRNVLDSMSRNRMESDLAAARDKLEKILPKLVTQFSSDPGQVKEALLRLILKQAKELRQVRDEIMFDRLCDSLVEERVEFKKRDEYKEFDSSSETAERDLEESLLLLTSRGIFFQGIKPRCDGCGSRFWYDAEEIRTKLSCKGCKEEIQLPVEIRWTYRLNKLVLNAFANYGVIPVVYALGNQLHESRDSFIYVPSVELFSNTEPKQSLTDLRSCFY